MARRVNCSMTIILMLVMLFSVTIVSAAPPFQSTEVSIEGLYIEAVNSLYLEQGVNHTFHFRVYNESNGVYIDPADVTCAMGILDNYGNYIHQALDPTPVGYRYDVLVASGNFTELGIYHKGINCLLDDGTQGGVLTQSFQVTRTGYLVESVNSIIVVALISLAFIFLALSFFFKDDYWILKSLFQFMAVLAGLISVNSARIIASESDALGIMGESGIILMIVVLLIFFLWIFVKAFKEIIKVFKDKGDLRWNYD